jgi:hypothetical protein
MIVGDVVGVCRETSEDAVNARILGGEGDSPERRVKNKTKHEQTTYFGVVSLSSPSRPDSSVISNCCALSFSLEFCLLIGTAC